MDKKKYEVITLLSSDEETPPLITSPKLSLKRKTNSGDTPVKKRKLSKDSDPERICSSTSKHKPVTTSNSALESINENLFPWTATDDIANKYKKLLNFCKLSMKCSPEEESKIVKKFLKLFQKADVQYTKSIPFLELLHETVLKVKNDPSNTFVHLTYINNKLKEHKKPDLSSNLTSLSDRSKSDDNMKQIPSDEPEIALHLSNSALKDSKSINHFTQSAHKVLEIASDFSNKESKIIENINETEKIPNNELQNGCGLLNDNLEVPIRENHVKQIPTKIPDITPVLVNFHESKDIGQIRDGKLENESNSSNLRDKSEIAKCTEEVGTFLADEPKISTDFAEPQSPSLISSNSMKSVEIVDSRSSPTDFNPTVIESSVKSSCVNEFFRDPLTANNISENEISSDVTRPGNDLCDIISPNLVESPSLLSPIPTESAQKPDLISSPNPVESIETKDSRSSPTGLPTVIESSITGSCVDEFYQRPSTSKDADYAEMLFSSSLPGSTLEEIYRESYRLPVDDMTRDAIEKQQDLLLSKKIAYSVPDSELPIPVINHEKRDSLLEKGNDSDSTSSFPDKSFKLNPKKDSVQKHKRSGKGEDSDSAASLPNEGCKPDPKKDSAPKHRSKDEEKLELRIKWLENYLGKLDKKIKKLQSKELSLEDLDDEDSAYIIEDRYKKKFQKVFAQLCKLKKASSRVGRKIEKHFSYEGTRYQPINKAIERLINKKKAAEKFPDYKEILEKVKEVNQSHRCDIDKFREESLASQIFKEVGRELQRRRILDEEEDLRSYCPEDADVEYDPADHDQNLQSKLISSAEEGEKKINEIIERFAERQREEDVVHSDVKEVVETSEDEQEDSDIPETDPATPSTDERVDGVEPEDDPPKTESSKEPEKESSKEDVPAPDNDPDIIDIGSSSDASTEPGTSVLERQKSDVRPSLLNGAPVFISDDFQVFEESNQGLGNDSSPDLPSLQDIFSHCS